MVLVTGPEPSILWLSHLLKVARKTRSYGLRCWSRPSSDRTPQAKPWPKVLAHCLELMGRVIEQNRRVLQGEKVPAPEKVISIFEEHTDIIEKGARESIFAHKLYPSIGQSSLILDALLLRGNPADNQQVKPLLRRQWELYGRYPRQASFDGGFACPDNLK